MNIVNFRLLSIVVLALFFTGVAYGHKGHDQDKTDSTETAVHVDMSAGMQQTGEMEAHHQSIMGKADLSDFPTLHPLVVHFPIVLLILAVISQFAGLFVYKEQLSWVTLVFVFFGFVGTLLATRYIHPHTVELGEVPAWLLEQHEKYANLTLYSSAIAVVLKILSHFLLKRQRWAEILVFITLGFSAYFVASASHFGAQLTHIEGIGPQGHFLEMHSSEQEHDHEH